MSIATTNPFNGRVLKTFEPYSPDQIELRMKQAHDAYLKAVSDLEAEQLRRTLVLKKAADLLLERKHDLAQIITFEMGKTLKSSIQEVEKCALNCRYYAESGLAMLQSEKIQLKGKHAEHRYLPIGIVLAVMPWNFPFWQVFRGAAPILLSGNSFVLKHASNVPQCALAIEKVFVDAGLSQGAFQTLLVGSDAIAKLIEDPRVQGVTLTGSEGAGREVASLAGHAIKKSVMELGGSDPFMVMPSADLTKAVETAVKARLVCSGQSCIAAKRFIVHDSIYDAFKAAFVEKMHHQLMGDPNEEATDLGPLVSIKARDELHALVKDASDRGAKILTGGKVPEGVGSFYPATVIEGLSNDAKLREEEAFGPVAVLYRVDSLREAIELANATRFGLGSSFWSNDAKEVAEAVTKIQAGSVFVNEMVASDPHLAFGGVKSSGYGRELGSIGMREFTNLKTIVIVD
jgi:succinate-semialdehyde dehydrogenase/glutarate-semialdehyde dehydrogenase